MQPSKKYLLALLFGWIVLMPIFFAAFFLVQQSRIRWEMKNNLKQQHLQTIILPVNQVQWIEEGEELLVGNELFDVKSLVIKDGKAILTGLFDKQEEALYRQLDNLIDDDDEGAANESAANCFSVFFGADAHSFSTSAVLNSRLLPTSFFDRPSALVSRALAVPALPPITCPVYNAC